jgi:hypothetical protein
MGDNHLRCFTYLCRLVCTQSVDLLVRVALVNGEGQSHRHESFRGEPCQLHRSAQVEGVKMPYLDVLLQILRALEGLATEVTLVWLQRNMDSDVGSNMVTFHGGSTARVPSACEVQVVGALSSHVLLTDMLLRGELALLDTTIYHHHHAKRLTKRASADGQRSEHLSH